MTLLVTLGGLSTRFGLKRPKWMLTHPRGHTMLEAVIRGVYNPLHFDKIVLAVTDQVLMEFELDVPTVLRAAAEFPVTVCKLPGASRSQLETAARCIEQMQITGPVLVKDCDSYLEWDGNSWPRNGVIVHRVSQNDQIPRLQNKSFAIASHRNQLLIDRVSEKRMASDVICVGGYLFEQAHEIVSSYRALIINAIEPLFMSDAVNDCILRYGAEFHHIHAVRYLDWGTFDEWKAYTARFRNWIIDIDGTILTNTSRFGPKRWGSGLPLTRTVEALRALSPEYNHVTLMSARPESLRADTRAELMALSIHFDQLILGALHAPRTVVNDFNDSTAAYPMATAINVLRDSDDLGLLLKPV